LRIIFLGGEIFEFFIILLLPSDTFECKWQGYSVTHHGPLSLMSFKEVICFTQHCHCLVARAPSCGGSGGGKLIIFVGSHSMRNNASSLPKVDGFVR
jgi:hypothetical protein